MTNRNLWICILLLTLMPLASMVSSCSSSDDDITNVPEKESDEIISFSGALAEVSEQTTRAEGSTPLCDLDTKFTLYGYKTRGDNPSLVFNKYTIEWMKSSKEWEYGHFPNQSIKFWDFSADNYKFWAATRIDDDKYYFDDNRTTLHINKVCLTLSEPEYLPLYSRINMRKPTIHPVTMEFSRVYAKMRILFYTTQKLKENEVIEITDIKFAPVTGSITASADIVIDYSDGTNPGVGLSDQTQEEVLDAKFNVSIKSTCNELEYDDLVLTSEAGTASNNTVVARPKNGETFVYLPPLDPTADPVAYKMSICVDGDDRTAEVPSNFMKWQPNFCYTYIFKILEGGVIFVDAQIEPWSNGGSASDVWHNW